VEEHLRDMPEEERKAAAAAWHKKHDRAGEAWDIAAMLQKRQEVDPEKVGGYLVSASGVGVPYTLAGIVLSKDSARGFAMNCTFYGVQWKLNYGEGFGQDLSFYNSSFTKFRESKPVTFTVEGAFGVGAEEAAEAWGGGKPLPVVTVGKGCN